MKEREQGERDTETEREDMGRKQRERQRVKAKEVRYFMPIAGADEGHVFKTQMCTTHRYWSHSLLVICSGHPDHEPTTSRLPVRNGAPALQVEQGPSCGETPP